MNNDDYARIVETANQRKLLAQSVRDAQDKEEELKASYDEIIAYAYSQIFNKRVVDVLSPVHQCLYCNDENLRSAGSCTRCTLLSVIKTGNWDGISVEIIARVER